MTPRWFRWRKAAPKVKAHCSLCCENADVDSPQQAVGWLEAHEPTCRWRAITRRENGQADRGAAAIRRNRVAAVLADDAVERLSKLGADAEVPVQVAASMVALVLAALGGATDPALLGAGDRPVLAARLVAANRESVEW